MILDNIVLYKYIISRYINIFLLLFIIFYIYDIAFCNISHPYITSKETNFWFLSHCMKYDRGDSFPFDYEPNGVPLVSQSKGKLSPRSHSLQSERNLKSKYLRVHWENGSRIKSPGPKSPRKKNKKKNLFILSFVFL